MATKKTGGQEEGKAAACRCPLCEGPVECGMFPICHPCGVSLRQCKACNTVMDKNARTCPKCGAGVE